MGSFSLSHWLVVLAIVLIVFGAGRIPNAMGDLARGLRAFRTGIRDESAAEPEAGKLVEATDQKRTCAAARSRQSLALRGLRMAPVLHHQSTP